MMLNKDQSKKAAFFAQLLAFLYQSPPSLELLEELAQLNLSPEWPFTTDANSASAFDDIEKALSEQDLEDLRQTLRDEHMLLFIGAGMPLVPLWGSVYLDEENLLMGESTFALEDFLAQTGLRVLQLDGREPLDHLGLILSSIHALLLRLTSPAENKDQTEAQIKELLQIHVNPWAWRCLELLAERAASPFYQGLGKLTAAMLDSLSSVCGAGQVERRIYH